MSKSRTLSFLAALVAMFMAANATSYETGADAPSFVNFETPHVSPIAMTPDGTKLLVVDTPDNRVVVFDLTGRAPRSLGSVAVGLDPVSVGARSNTEAWVVNHVSDSISIVNLATLNVVRTLSTGDEPTDVVFAGTPQRAFVSVSQENKIQVFDLANLSAAPTDVGIEGEDPRQLATSPDGQKIYVAVFESNNGTTILGSHQGRNPVSDLSGPYEGQNPPPNSGTAFVPPINPILPVQPPKMGLIVRKNASGNWLDVNNAEWTDWVTGSHANDSDRIAGWDVVDNDVAVIDANTLAVSYMTGMMNLVMALGVKPNGDVTAVGTEATNEVRFESNLKARFVRVKMATANTANPGTPTILDINPHLTYSDSQIAQQADPATFDQSLVDQSIGDPRAIKWNSQGTRAYISGMGSNNVVVIDSAGNRVGSPIKVGEGPTGIALDSPRGKVYVLNKFSATVSVIKAKNNTVQSTVALFDPSPAAIKSGRKFLYSTSATSGLGQLSCASCHVDSRIDKLAWDLGNPAGDMVAVAGRNCGYGVETDKECHDYHPMKAPMTTQTLQDIIGHEPLHWRGDKKGLEEFNVAFTNLQGRPSQLTDTEMQQFEDFLATIHMPPNPYRNFDNTLPTTLDLSSFESLGRFSRNGGTGLPPGAPLLPGNPVNGLSLYRTRPAHMAGPGGKPGHFTTCVMCHTLPTGMGADVTFVGDVSRFPAAGSGIFVDNVPGAKGERNLMITGLPFGDANQINTFKVPQLRNLYDKRGFTLKVPRSLSGFGFAQDGSDTLDSFISHFGGIVNDQEVSDIISFLMTFSGSDLPMGSLTTLEEPPGTLSKDAHAAVGKQITFDGTNNLDPGLLARLGDMTGMADAGKIGLVANGIWQARRRGFAYTGASVLQSDHAGETTTVDALRTAAASGAEITFTVVPKGSETRIGIDRDLDGILDFDDRIIQ